MAETEITPENYQSRYALDAERQFRHAARIAMRSMNSQEERERWRLRAFELVAAALVEHADYAGFTIDLDREVRVHEKEFDFGAAVGIGGSLTGRFTATQEQMCRWLVTECERKDEQIRAQLETIRTLESRWTRRAWRWVLALWRWRPEPEPEP